MKRFLFLLGLAALLAGCRERTLRREDFSVHGIDVSHHQKRIDWKTVAQQNILFAFVKASEGETLRDSLFCENWTETKTAGIRRGAYHFFRPAISAEAQAKNFSECVELEHGDLPPVLDVEVTDDVSPEELRLGLYTWLNLVENAFCIRPIIYTNQKFFNGYLAGHFPGYPIWIARYSSWRKPSLKDDQSWHFWQYGNRGRLNGIVGDVDFNVFIGSRQELEGFCLVKPEAPAPPSPSSEKDLTSNP